jgi:DNA-binding transcriptional MerR regulator
MEGYGVGDVAQRFGVTVRTLHHYDHIGLLCPGGRSEAGYRVYTAADVERLVRIVALRATGMPLSTVATALEANPVERTGLLHGQANALAEQQQQIDRQRAALARMMEADAMGIDLSPEESFELFGDHDPAAYEDEVRERWGDTDAYQESHRRTSSYTKADWARLREQSESVEAEFAACLVDGVASDSERAKAAAEAHRRHIDTWFYPCSYDMQCGLADMYVADPRFAAHYDERAPGLAVYVRDAILANALDHIS